ncbi:MAG: hypothetical protein O2817_06175 [Proteobacteria bacterium]|nr:hypothetical protein [Pseudomonadota bacterium]
MAKTKKIELLKTAILVNWIAGDRGEQRRTGDFFFGRYDDQGNEVSDNFVSSPEVFEALRELENDELVTGYHNDFAESRWFLNVKAALGFHTDNIHDPKSLLHQIEKLGHDWVIEILENHSSDVMPETKEIEVETEAKSSFDPVDDGEVIRDRDGEPVADEDGIPIVTMINRPAGIEIGDSPADAEALAEFIDDAAEDREAVAPASDRIVKRSDNEETWENAVVGAKELHDALVATNDHGDIDEDEFEQKLSEVRALQIMLESPQIHWDVLEHFAEKTVKYFAEKFVDHVIGIAASGLMGFLGALLAGAL